MATGKTLTVVFRSDHQNQGMLLSPYLDGLIAADHPVRIVNEVLDKVAITELRREYKPGGTSSYLPACYAKYSCMDKKGETHRGFYWVYQDSIDKIVFFDYQEGRGREGLMEMLENFKGYLQTDGYVAYDVFDKRPNITLIHCMAHARRMFNEALDNDITSPPLVRF